MSSATSFHTIQSPILTPPQKVLTVSPTSSSENEISFSPEWIEELKEKLQCPPVDTDICFLAPGISVEQLNKIRYALILFFSGKIPKKKQTVQVRKEITKILKNNFPERYSKLLADEKELFHYAIKDLFFSKLMTSSEESTTKCFIVGFGNCDNKAYDLSIFPFSTCMFSRTSVRLPFLNFFSGDERFILPVSDCLDGGQALVDILADGFSIPNNGTIDPTYFIRMLSNYSKGQRCLTHGGEEAITSVFLEALKNKDNPSDYIWNAIYTCVENHHKGDVYSLVCLTANALRILHPYLSHEDVENIRNKLSKSSCADSDDPFLKVINIVHQALSDPLIPLTALFSLLQAAVFFICVVLK